MKKLRAKIKQAWSDYGWNTFNPDGSINWGVQLPKDKKVAMTSEEYYNRKR